MAITLATLRYPADLKPFHSTIRFTCRDGKELGAVIDLPIPLGVKFTDGGDYGTKDLGVEADAADTLAASAQNLSNVGGLAKGAATLGVAAIANKAISGVGELGDKVQFYRKQIVPPNTNTIFKGNTLRNFSFDFKMVARTFQDTEMIRGIHKTLRRYIYASSVEGISAKLVNSYPPVWTVEFFIDGVESPYYPKIYGCYMTGVDSSLGNLSNAKMANGAPIDIDLSVHFQETRVLNRVDIDALEDKNDRGIDPNTGLARA